MQERRLEKHGVVFAMWDGNVIQLERRTKKKDEFKDLVILPGGSVETDQTIIGALFTEVFQEYGVVISRCRKIGMFPSTEPQGILNIRHLFLVDEWKGKLSNPEEKSEHMEASIEDSFNLCKHPLTKIFLEEIEIAIEKLSG